MPVSSSNALIDQEAFIAVTAVVCAVLITTHVLFLFMGSDVSLRMPSRWAGLNAMPLWLLWLLSFILTVGSYCVFFSLFIISDTRANANSMYGAVNITSIIFCFSEAVWPYLLRRAEKQTIEVYDGSVDCLHFLEYLICFPFVCVPVDSSRWLVIVNISFSALLSILMLVFYIVGALGSDDGIEMDWLIASLSYIMFHCVVVDMWFWGYTWYYDMHSEWKEGWIHFSNNEKQPQMAGNAYSVLWSDVKLFDYRC